MRISHNVDRKSTAVLRVPNRASRVLIVGASARAAAYSSLRAGYAPIAIDLFGDRDLAAIAPSFRVPRREYPGEIEPIAAAIDRDAWFYTGALENRPELIEKLERQGISWGNPASVVRAVRNPFQLHQVLISHRLPSPRPFDSRSNPPAAIATLAKPFASAAGRSIEFVGPGESSKIQEPFYYQEYVQGDSYGAIFAGRNGISKLLGISRQWIGTRDRRFVYRGSVAPWPIDRKTRELLIEIGRAVVAEFGLVGIFGIDFILRGDIPYPVEINPRYTASVEAIELATRRSLLILQEPGNDFDDCENVDLYRNRNQSRRRYVGKGIVFAERSFTFDDRVLRATDRTAVYRDESNAAADFEGGETLEQDDRFFKIPKIADIPNAGERFDRGDPVLTVFAVSSDPEACRERLGRRVELWTARLSRLAQADSTEQIGSSNE